MNTPTGVDVYDSYGDCHGRSVIAAKQGISKCCAARVLWSIPILVLPPLVMARVERVPAIARNPRLRLAAEILLISGILWGAVPAAIAVFPQKDSAMASELEPEIAARSDRHGQPLSKVTFNKGL
mmetsp:Transcript_73912/g.173531  ORF Transcript_73912/g.173531 Transcript_73912/m.173531 type:complete len:125 (-) Transcript_73912:42-416(-)